MEHPVAIEDVDGRNVDKGLIWLDLSTLDHIAIQAHDPLSKLHVVSHDVRCNHWVSLRELQRLDSDSAAVAQDLIQSIESNPSSGHAVIINKLLSFGFETSGDQ